MLENLRQLRMSTGQRMRPHLISMESAAKASHAMQSAMLKEAERIYGSSAFQDDGYVMRIDPLGYIEFQMESMGEVEQPLPGLVDIVESAHLLVGVACELAPCPLTGKAPRLPEEQDLFQYIDGESHSGSSSSGEEDEDLFVDDNDDDEEEGNIDDNTNTNIKIISVPSSSSSPEEEAPKHTTLTTTNTSLAAWRLKNTETRARKAARAAACKAVEEQTTTDEDEFLTKSDEEEEVVAAAP